MLLPLRDVLLFSDIDGTLIDALGRPPRAWEAVRDVLDDALIVLCSSRTVPEVVAAQHRLGLHGPFIAENGAVLAFRKDWVATPPGAVTHDGFPDFRTIRLGHGSVQLRSVLLGVASALLFSVEVITEEEVQRVSLDADSAERLVLLRDASHRTHSVLLRILAGPERTALLRHAMARAQLTISDGGRWHVAQHGSSKGMAARLMRTMLTPHLRPQAPSVGIGDSENDRSLLEATDIRWVLRQANGQVHPALASLDDVSIADTPGVDGWTDLLPHLRRDLVTTGGLANE